MCEREKLSRLIDQAAGRAPADLLITNCRLADVFNQTLREGPLALGGGLILGWGEGYEAAETLDARGGIVLPGFIDGHVHIESSALTPPRFARAVLPFGTTTVVADPHEIANVLGLAGLDYMLDSARGLPLNVHIMLPSCVPATAFEEAGAELSAADLAGLAGREGVLGLGEVMNYPGVVARDEGVLDKLLLAQAKGLAMDGHSPGLAGPRLSAYAAAGLKTDHECGDPEAVLERLARGQYVLLREASSSPDLLNLLPAVTPANLRHCLFCTDDREAADILARGHINHSLRLAVRAGLEPLAAVAMATLNAAECYGLKGRGALAPGYVADLVIVEDLKDFKARHVFSRGGEVARAGRLLADIKASPLPLAVLNTVRLAPPTLDDLALPLAGGRVLAIGIRPGSLLTDRLEISVERDAAGRFEPRLNPGLNKLAVVERHRASGRLGLGVLSGYGLKNGALASTVAHDAHHLIVAGDNDSDMLAAIRQVAAQGGGFAAVRAGKVLAGLALPVAGLMADREARDVAGDMEKLLRAAHGELGLPESIHPLMALSFLSLTVIPELKLTCGGLFDVSAFKPVSLEPPAA
ncbi:MAG: adenine deaminase [Candidatus Adiutrix sp.]|jgi:adenine deaminase|nr:adenine deaminase [Candidatus Adiutrix sp.]